MIDKDTITHRHWSLKVARLNPETGVSADVFGSVVLALDDLHQSIANIIMTPKGSAPTEPEKGCDVLSAIDKHPDVGVPILTREITDALTIWEPRIVVQKVTVTMTAYSHFKTQVSWRPIESVMDELLMTEVTYG
ncbi:hypothetical protein RvVAT039_08890 [Agrobacterium vitis]|uniref:GPW/gp25 family protein n=1 Tax=Agrobacterium vitis TaxID=373 RepID=UPI0015D6DB63|nr:GPW/gp25 family protein [Agrobacterium vitis]BCH58507.1 hypothetical protein RvVAR0630_11310 [Agrobacterium vitis]BCH63673.1 hypothetical protein RvVAT039_08890 [Agrobacterium vitis]